MQAMARLVGAMLLAPSLQVQADSPQIADAVACLRANLPQQSVLDIRARTLDGSGEISARSLSVATRRSPAHSDANIRVSMPADLAGTTYLIRKQKSEADSTLVYLPAVGRVQRIQGNAGGTILGTTLSADDLRHLFSGFSDGATSLGPAGRVHNWTTRRLYLMTSPGQDSAYDKIEAEVAQPECVVVEARFYLDNRLRKQLQARPDSIRQQGRYHYASQLTVSAPNDPMRTEIEIRHFDGDAIPDASLFDAKTFHRP